MLDLDNPSTKHIFNAAGAMDRLLERAKRMTLLPSAQRLKVLAACQKDLQLLRELNSSHFLASPFIFDAIEELAAALHKLAVLGEGRITADRSDGEGDCPACGQRITKFKTEVFTDAYFERVGKLDKNSKQFRKQLDHLPGEKEDCWHIYCDKCLDLVGPARTKLDSPEGFSTMFI